MSLYARWMESWEQRLTLKDRNRVMFPFSWGLEWISEDGFARRPAVDFLREWAQSTIQSSRDFYSSPPVQSARLENNELTFDTPTPGPIQENNKVHCRFFPASGDCAVVVVPQWNADPGSHVGLCKLLRLLGISALRMTMPFHERRAQEQSQRADFMVSPNLGRTIYATRQAVLEVRQAVGWLLSSGYRRIGVIGTSLGSCVSYLAFTHDLRIQVAVFNHVSSFFADVVWRGLSTRYVRWGLEGQVDLKHLRTFWGPLSPWHFVPMLSGDNYRPHLMVTAKYDLTFLPELSEQVFERYRTFGIPYERVDLPCGHYTTAHIPFSLLDGFHICRYLKRHFGTSRSS